MVKGSNVLRQKLYSSYITAVCRKPSISAVDNNMAILGDNMTLNQTMSPIVTTRSSLKSTVTRRLDYLPKRVTTHCTLTPSFNTGDSVLRTRYWNRGLAPSVPICCIRLNQRNPRLCIDAKQYTCTNRPMTSITLLNTTYSVHPCLKNLVRLKTHYLVLSDLEEPYLANSEKFHRLEPILNNKLRTDS